MKWSSINACIVRIFIVIVLVVEAISHTDVDFFVENISEYSLTTGNELLSKLLREHAPKEFLLRFKAALVDGLI